MLGAHRALPDVLAMEAVLTHPSLVRCPSMKDFSNAWKIKEYEMKLWEISFKRHLTSWNSFIYHSLSTGTSPSSWKQFFLQLLAPTRHCSGTQNLHREVSPTPGLRRCIFLCEFTYPALFRATRPRSRIARIISRSILFSCAHRRS